MYKYLALTMSALLLLTPPILSQTKDDKKTEKQAKENAKREREQYEREQREKIKFFAVTTEPAGATVSLNGETLGTTPLKRPVKVKFFYSGPTFAFSSYLNSPVTMTVAKEGYVTQSIVVTKGPFQWVSLNGVNRLYYYIVAQPEFHVKLEKVGEFLGTNPFAKPSTTNADKSGPLSTEEIVQKALPAVVTVSTPTGSGSGFFILQSGVVVTNKHVVGSNSRVSVITSKGETLLSRSVFVHPYRDLALIKVEGSDFPAIPLSDPSSIQVGSDVVAIGSPGLGSATLQNSVTKGIVSAFRNSETKGLLIQTDAALNHGNSGGPLLNRAGEMVGVNTFGYVDFDKEGLSFSLFVSEVLAMLKEHFNYVPDYSYASKPLSDSSVKTEVRATLSVNSVPDGAEIYLNNKLVGNTPSKISVTPGTHTLKVSLPGYKDWSREITIEAGSEPNFKAVLRESSPNFSYRVPYIVL